MTGTTQRTCPACGSENRQDGYLGYYFHTFVPSFVPYFRRFMGVRGYKAYGVVCLNCGYLSHYLTDKDIQEIRSQLEKRQGK